MLSFFKQMVLLMLREVGKFQKESSLLIWTLKDKSKHQANGRTFEMCGVGITKALERKQDEAEVSSVAQSCPTLCAYIIYVYMYIIHNIYVYIIYMYNTYYICIQ